MDFTYCVVLCEEGGQVCKVDSGWLRVVKGFQHTDSTVQPQSVTVTYWPGVVAV